MNRLMSEMFLAGFAFSFLYTQPGLAMTPAQILDPSCDAVTADNPEIPEIFSKRLTAPDTNKYAFYFQRKYKLDNGTEKKLIFKISSDDPKEGKETLFRRLDKQSKPLNWLMEKNLGQRPSEEKPQMIAWPTDENDTNNQVIKRFELREKFCTKHADDVASFD